jgi:hypothetical protein
MAEEGVGRGNNRGVPVRHHRPSADPHGSAEDGNWRAGVAASRFAPHVRHHPAEMEVEPHIVERLLNHSMGAIGNQADSIVSAVAEVYILAKYMLKMRPAIETKWETATAMLPGIAAWALQVRRHWR